MAIRITGMASGMDTDAMVKDLVSAYRKKGEKISKTQTKTEWKQEAWTDLNNKVKTFFNKYASEMRFSSAYAKKTTTSSDTSKASVVASENAVSGTQTLEINSIAKAGYLTGGKLEMKDSEGNPVKVTADTKLSELGYTGGSQYMSIGFGKQKPDGSYENQTEEFNIDNDTTVGDFVRLVASSSSGINASFDEANGRIFVNSTKSGVDNDFHFMSDGDLGKVTDALGLTGGSEKRIDGQNAKIVLNEVEYESDSNTFSINGLTINAKDTTDGNKITLSTDTDYDGIYNSIKEFFKEYNSLVNEFSKLYNADSAKGYDPLTSEEKEEMSDDEIEKWEQKIKDSLLRRDGDLDKLNQAMINPMLKVYEVNGTKYSLSSFGIETADYFTAAENEKNAYHIAGDMDDSYGSLLSDKLKSMIATNPEDTAEFFQKLIGGLYDSLNDIQGRSTDSKSYGSYYDDKLLKEEITNQKKKVTDWESKVADIEEKYYKQFSAMEQAMTKLNAQQSSISQMLGM